MSLIRRLVVGVLVVGVAGTAGAQHDPAHHAAMHASPPTTTPAKDARQAVSFPADLREHTLANMRDHLVVLQQLQGALAEQKFDAAADLAESRLGMSSLGLHGAHDVAPYMPAGMQAAGTAMHRSASRFALAARDAAVIGDLKPALAALAEVTAQCVACHAAYRLK